MVRHRAARGARLERGLGSRRQRGRLERRPRVRRPGEPRRALWTTTSAGLLDSSSSPSEALDINATAEVVGKATAQDGAQFGFHWGPETGFRDLNDLAVPLPGLHLAEAVAINDSGQILCNGTIGTDSRVFLLAPWGTLFTAEDAVVAIPVDTAVFPLE